jgi:hypothetical protein
MTTTCGSSTCLPVLADGGLFPREDSRVSPRAISEGLSTVGQRRGRVARLGNPREEIRLIPLPSYAGELQDGRPNRATAEVPIGQIPRYHPSPRPSSSRAGSGQTYPATASTRAPPGMPCSEPGWGSRTRIAPSV